MSAIVTVASSSSAASFRRVLTEAPPGSVIAVIDDAVSNEARDADLLEVLVTNAKSAGVASASPVPVGNEQPARYATHPLLPPPSSLGLPCRRLCVLDVDAVSSLGDIRPVAGSASDQLVSIGIQLLQHGWRHVAAPGVAMGWDPADPTGILPGAAWTPAMVASLVGNANAGLETHVTWAKSRVETLTVVVDGECLDGDLHTGTQHLVLEVTQQLHATRPDASISIAVPRASIDIVRSALAGAAVDAVERSSSISADVMYRPYQMLRVDELDAVMNVGRRRLVGQLDMIGFSNPFYHPSPQLFSSARNLQRHMMRRCDGVTFISNYGREAAVAECPDLVPSRLHVVSCGADPLPVDGPVPPRADLVDAPFLLCLSATFWHKNRGHAIATFADLVATTGYEGSLVIVGPEPFYGRSTDDDDVHLAALPPSVNARVLRLGQASEREKWWLLQHAQAVLYPSVLEGFGLVPFEAAVAGTPCLAYAGTAPAELLAATDATIGTWDPAAWAKRLAVWIAEESESAAVVASVTAVATTYTWRRCAELTWQAIDASLAQPSRSEPAQDGGTLSAVVPGQMAAHRLNNLRFHAARAQPAITRRVRDIARKVRKA